MTDDTVDEEPPICFLFFCNVRTWTLAVSVIYTIVMLYHNYSIIFDKQPTENHAFDVYRIIFFIVFIGLIGLNIALGYAVVKRKTDIVRTWLKVYLVLFVCWTILTTGLLFLYYMIKYLHEPIPSEYMEEDLVFLIVFEIWMIGSSYPVYEYYEFEKSRPPLQENYDHFGL